MLITIDGPAGTGKSTIAKKLAQELGWQYYNTGALYRALTAWMLRQGWIEVGTTIPAADLGQRLQTVDMQVTSDRSPQYRVQGQDMTSATRDQSLALLVSRVSSWASVRAYLLQIQRRLAQSRHAIFEGRDMGTVVFPQADFKIYLTASAQARAERRFQELVEQGMHPPSLDTLRQEIEKRDKQDMERELSPLRIPEDAQVIDTTYLAMDQVLEEILRFLQKRGFSK